MGLPMYSQYNRTPFYRLFNGKVAMLLILDEKLLINKTEAELFSLYWRLLRLQAWVVWPANTPGVLIT